MPVYSIENIETQTQFEISMKYSELEEYLKTTPNVRQIYTRFPGVVDSVRIGVKKTPDSFRDVLQKAKQSHVHSTIEY